MNTRGPARLIVVLLLVSITLIAVDQVVGWGLLQQAWSWVSTPLQRWLFDGNEEACDFWERLHEADKMQEENEQLREMVAQLTFENRRYQEIKRENDELRQLLGLQERFPHLERLYAEIIGRDPASVRQVLRVAWSAPADDSVQVEVGMPVIGAAGLVGRVIEVYGHTADILLITDINSSVSAVLQNEDHASGVVDGRWQAGQRLRMRFIPPGSLVQEDDWVVTSGLQRPPFEGRAFPPGLPIGQILRVEVSSDLTLEAELLPAVDFDHLEWVMIVVGTR
ncbi:MAG: rod shape-determining protein MreC [Chloroflexia bacterium]|nr:rod shape-determining protein MreC [Chloroflexia bacterium]